MARHRDPLAGRRGRRVGKAVTVLGVPQRATWERLPGVTDTDVRRWAEMPVTSDGHGLPADVLARATG